MAAVVTAHGYPDTRIPNIESQRWESRLTSSVYWPFPGGFELGTVVYTASHVDEWSTSHPQYTLLVNAGSMSTSRTITSYGSSITTVDARDRLRADAEYAMGMAVLYATNENSTYRNKVLEVLDAVKNITVISATAGDDNLQAGWLCPNLVRAAFLVGYDDAAFATFLRNVLWPLMNWYQGGNWFSVFAASRLMIASYVEDLDLYSEAKDYLDFYAGRTIYHPDWDGASIRPMPAELWPAAKTGAPNATRTANHWWQAVTAAPWTASFNSLAFVAGQDCEFNRDLNHEVMGMMGWLLAYATIVGTGDTVSGMVHDRVKSNVDFLAERALHYEQTGTALAPAGPVVNSGRFGWHLAKRLFGSSVTDDVDDLLQLSTVTNYHAPGAHHWAAELMSEGGVL